MENKNKKKPGFSNIISSVATRTPLDLEKDNLENEVLDDDETVKDDLATVETKNKGKVTSKEKLIDFLTVVTQTSSIKEKSQIHISAENVNKIKLLSSFSGLNMYEISDGIITKFLEENKAAIKKLYSSKL